MSLDRVQKNRHDCFLCAQFGMRRAPLLEVRPTFCRGFYDRLHFRRFVFFQSPNSERDPIMPCAEKARFKTCLSISRDQTYRLHMVSKLQIRDHFFLNLNSGHASDLCFLCILIFSIHAHSC